MYNNYVASSRNTSPTPKTPQPTVLQAIPNRLHTTNGLGLARTCQNLVLQNATNSQRGMEPKHEAALLRSNKLIPFIPHLFLRDV